MTDITIKKDDGSTDVTYTMIVGSGGGKNPAVFRNNSATGYPGQRPEFSIQSRDNGDKSGRRVDLSYVYPDVYTDSATSTTKVLAKASFSGTALLPKNISDATAAEFGAQIGNLIAASLIEGTLTNGYAPT